MNGYLLDTNAFLWIGLSQTAIPSIIRDELFQADLFVSIISAVEIAIKASLGKLPLPAPFITDFEAGFRRLSERAAIDILPIELSAIERLRGLPLHHRDPFDRLIIAQALDMDLTLASSDRVFDAYPGLKLLRIRPQ